MSKKPVASKSPQKIVLCLPAGKATPAPPVGTALGPRGVDSKSFCRQFNERSLAENKEGVPVTVVITINPDKTFSFELKGPPTSFLIKDAIGLSKGVSSAKDGKTPTISISKIEELAAKKMQDLNCYKIAQAVDILIGSAKSMGIKVIGQSAK